MTPVVIDPAPMRECLYNTLTAAVEPAQGDIEMRQSMGVQLSQAVLKDKGVLNIQMQSVHVQNVLNNVTVMLKMLDKAEPAAVQVEEADCETVTNPDDVLEQIIDENVRSGVSLDDFLDGIAVRFLRRAIRHYGTTKAALEATKIPYSRVLKLRKTHNI